MSSRLQKTAVRLKPEEEDRRAKIWDNERGGWVNLTEEEIEKRWPAARIAQKLALEEELKRERLLR